MTNPITNTQSEYMQLMAIRGVIFSLDDEDQQRIKACAGKLRELLAEYGEHGAMALALVGAEMNVEAAP